MPRGRGSSKDCRGAGEGLRGDAQVFLQKEGGRSWGTAWAKAQERHGEGGHEIW